MLHERYECKDNASDPKGKCVARVTNWEDRNSCILEGVHEGGSDPGYAHYVCVSTFVMACHLLNQVESW